MASVVIWAPSGTADSSASSVYILDERLHRVDSVPPIYISTVDPAQENKKKKELNADSAVTVHKHLFKLVILYFPIG